jgi:acyl-CoA synthetase (AMP-forming)/AMP-acid ligase II
VLLSASTTRSFLVALYGSYLIGAVPVPAPPFGVSRGAERLARIVSTARPAVVVDADEAHEGVATVDAGPAVAIDAHAGASAGAVRAVLDAVPTVDPESPALLQFTSGSTLAPRGVVISHRALLENLAATSERFRVEPREVGVNWCPLYHDMGLIGGVMWPMYTRLINVLMPPERVVMNPISWLQTLSETKSVITTTPNFALALLNRRLRRPSDAFDLRDLRHVIIGGEPISPGVTSTFCELLAPSNLRASAMHPAWGMAENTLMATSARGGVRVHSVKRDALERQGRAVDASPSSSESRDVVCVGRPLVGTEVRVRRADGELAGGGDVGEVELRSTSLLSGYVGGEEEAAGVLSVDGWLRTGDLGYVHREELYLLGRSKELVIVGARNIVPTDIEDLVATIPRVRSGSVAAFGIPEGGTEALVVVAEVRGDDGTLERQVRQLLAGALDIVPRRVVLTTRGSLPRTSSGKLMRGLVRERHLRRGAANDEGTV